MCVEEECQVASLIVVPATIALTWAPLRCDLRDRCCEAYEVCVSCCMAPGHGAKERLAEVRARCACLETLQFHH